MLSIINQAGYAITNLDFTPESSSLPVGFMLLAAFFLAMIVSEAVKSRASLTQVSDKSQTCSDLA